MRSFRRHSPIFPKALSWSRLTLWETSPREYIRRYVHGEEFITKEMEFGRRIADGLDTDETNDLEVEHLRILLPDYRKSEHVIRTTFNGIPIYCRPDLWDGRRRKLGEVKTGKAPWTQKRADEHGQIDFYDMGAYAEYGWIPDNCLYWAPTEEVNGVIHLTGELHTFETPRKLRDIIKMGVRAKRAWEAIIKATEQELINAI